MTKCNVKTGDTVVVITGKDAGKVGKVLAVDTKKNRITVEGVNIISKHQKARKAQEKSQIVKKEGTIDISNVMVLCPVCGKPTRVKHSVVDGKNVRVCKCGASLEAKVEKKPAKKTTKTNQENAEKPAKTAKSTTKAAKASEEKAESTKEKAVVKKVKATSTTAKSTKTTTARKAQRGV